MSDYRTLLADLIGTADDPESLETADGILATRIPDLCPDCKGTGYGPFDSVRCTHPNAPTIADLLQWGENVASAEFGRIGGVKVGGLYYYGEVRPLLAALRGEGQ